MHNTSRVQSTINNQSSRGRDSRPPHGLALWLHFRLRENMSEAHTSGSFAPYAIKWLPSRYCPQHRKVMKQNSFKVIRCCFKYLRVNDRVAVRGLAKPFWHLFVGLWFRMILFGCIVLVMCGGFTNPPMGGSIRGGSRGHSPLLRFLGIYPQARCKYRNIYRF